MKKILVVEDNQDNMDLVKQILEEAGYQVFGTESAENGMEILRRGIPMDLILMDISLPNLDGYAATKIIKQDMKLGNIPIIMLTAHASKEDREKGIRAGCDAFYTKPIVDEADFLTTVAKFIQRGPNAN